MKTSYQNMATRSINAENDFIATLAEFGGITNDEAVRVFALYRKLKLVNIKDAYVNGRITVRHGSALDRDVIRRAAEG